MVLNIAWSLGLSAVDIVYSFLFFLPEEYGDDKLYRCYIKSIQVLTLNKAIC